MQGRPRRSVLYMPGSNERALEKAKTIPADALILDLEDAVAPDAKPLARDRVCAAVKTGGYGGREIVIRINALETPWGTDDLLAACAAAPDAILVPKVAHPGEVISVAKILQGLHAPEKIRLWAMMETPMATLRVFGKYEILAKIGQGGMSEVYRARVLDGPRSGELVAIAEPDAWFTYYYWGDESLAPDFARTVDIHRKPDTKLCGNTDIAPSAFLPHTGIVSSSQNRGEGGTWYSCRCT